LRPSLNSTRFSSVRRSEIGFKFVESALKRYALVDLFFSLELYTQCTQSHSRIVRVHLEMVVPLFYRLYAIMKRSIARTLCGLALIALAALGQDVIPLYPGTAPGSTDASYPEKAYFSTAWNEDVVPNVTKPTLTLYRPAAGTANGTAIVICPGGGFMALSINSEGIDVAKWLMARGSLPSS
jgi:hypothetical protein